MRDTMTKAAAVFEPEEVRVLESAFKVTRRRLSRITGAHDVTDTELARVIHNLGRSRLRLNRQLQTERHAAEIADEAVEHFTYLEEAPDAVVQAARESDVVARPSQRVVAAFPRSYREPPVNRL